jgi:phosphoesterase RecJ-like protein
MLTQDQQIFEQIKKAQNILITFNKTWNGDAVASALAFGMVLKKMDKKFDIIAEKIEKTNTFKFLPDYNAIKENIENLRKFIISLDTTNSKIEKIKYKKEEHSVEFIVYPSTGFFNHENITSRTGEFKYDLIIVIDTPDLESLGRVYDNDTEFFYQTPIINIDHHSNNEGYGQINKTELANISTAEIIFNILNNNYKDLIDDNIATCILTGIISKTNNYKNKNITPQVLSISSQLIALGARREQIVNKLYRSRSLNILKLWGRVLARLSSAIDNKLVWSILNKQDLLKTNTNEDEIPEVINELITNIPQATVIVIIYESEQDNQTATKAIIHTMKNINSFDLVKKYNPTGTKSFARITLNKNTKESENEIIETIKENFNKIVQQ